MSIDFTSDHNVFEGNEKTGWMAFANLKERLLKLNLSSFWPKQTGQFGPIRFQQVSQYGT